MVRGHRSQEPLRPVWNRWKLVGLASLDLTEQVEALVARLEPITDAVARVVRRVQSDPADVGLWHEQGVAGLSVVRRFSRNRSEGTDLGLHLSNRVIQFLAATGSSVDVDEYDWT